DDQRDAPADAGDPDRRVVARRPIALRRRGRHYNAVRWTGGSRWRRVAGRLRLVGCSASVDLVADVRLVDGVGFAAGVALRLVGGLARISGLAVLLALAVGDPLAELGDPAVRVAGRATVGLGGEIATVVIQRHLCVALQSIRLAEIEQDLR